MSCLSGVNYPTVLMLRVTGTVSCVFLTCELRSSVSERQGPIADKLHQLECIVDENRCVGSMLQEDQGGISDSP
jgi:hypothetical protein